MAAERRATAIWEGNLFEGSGKVAMDSSGIGEFDVTWAARTEQPAGKTSPEELIAAAHAACFSMAFSHELAQAGSAPERLATRAAVTFVPGTGITKIALAVRGRVPGMDDDRFRELAEAAKEGCPVSQALAAVPEITLDATLET